MKRCSYCYTLLILFGALTLAACGGAGATAAPVATQPANSPVAATAGAPASPGPETPVPAAYPEGTLAPGPLPTDSAYPGAPAAEITAAPASDAYPGAPATAPSGQGKEAETALVGLAKQDLAKQLSVAADQILVVSVTPTDWPDSSLGCPKPGMAYAQVITPGFRIILEQAQKQYAYHTNQTDQVVLCTP